MIVLDEAGTKVSSSMLRVSPTSQSPRERGPVIIRRYKVREARASMCARHDVNWWARGLGAPAPVIGDRSGPGSMPSTSVQRAAPEPNGNGSSRP